MAADCQRDAEELAKCSDTRPGGFKLVPEKPTPRPASPNRNLSDETASPGRRRIVDPSSLWSLRVSRADHHHSLVPLRVFPDATVAEVKLLLAGVTQVPPSEMRLHCAGNELRGGRLCDMTRLGLKDLATLVMERRPDLVRAAYYRDRFGAAAAAANATATTMPRAEYLAALNHIPRRPFLSQDLRSAIVRIAQTDSVNELSPITSRLDAGESLDSVDVLCGMTPLQLSLLYGSNPSLAVVLLTGYKASPNAMVAESFISPLEDVNAVESSEPIDLRGIDTLPLVLATRRIELFTVIPKLAERTAPATLRSPRVLAALRGAAEEAADEARRVQEALGGNAEGPEDGTVVALQRMVRDVEEMQRAQAPMASEAWR